MEPDKESLFQSLHDETIDAMEEVEAAGDEHATFQQKLAARVRVEDVVRKFREARQAVAEADRDAIDRGLGRKVIDLQKMSTHLPAPPAGARVEKKAESQFWETREGKSSRQPVQIGANAPQKGAPRYRVTGEIEAWCGPCNSMKTHVISAMVGDVPAQVVCQACGKTHKYRDTPPEKKKSAAAAPGGGVSQRPNAAQQETEKRNKERNALVAELQAAEAVREYSPKERYKAGEYVSHPEHGRGKIENVLPRSLMVRFPAGLKTLKLT